MKNVNKMSTARGMFLLGQTIPYICKFLNIDRNHLCYEAEKWLHDLRKPKQVEAQVKMNHIRYLEARLFEAIENKEDEKTIDELQRNYVSYLI
jgi:hypothetical protein